MFTHIVRLLSRPKRHAAPAVPVRRLFVDVSTIIRHDAGTGIQRVVRAVCDHLARNAGGDVAVQAVAATGSSPYVPVSVDVLPGGIASPAIPIALGPGDVFLGLDLCAHLLSRHRRQLRRWKRAGASIAIVVYDLLPFTHPHWFNARTVRHFRKWLNVVGAEADLLLPISRTVLDELSAYIRRCHPRRQKSLRYQILALSGEIAMAGGSDGLPEKADGILAAIRSRRSILMVGTIEPRKGYAEALAAHRHLWNSRPDLAPYLFIVGKGGWKTKDMQTALSAHSLEDQGVVWLGSVSDAFLEQLYDSCFAVLVASHGEGYCLPLHEAITRGRLVLARDLPVLREFQSPLLRYFADDSPGALSAALASLLAETPPTVLASESQGWANTVHILLDAIKGLGPADQLQRRNRADTV